MKSADNNVPNNEDRYPQMAVLMDKGSPEVSLWNLSLTPIPPEHLIVDLDVEYAKAAGERHCFRSPDRLSRHIVIEVGDPALREKLPRAIAGRSPRAIVQYDVSHDSSPAAITWAPAMALKPRKLSHNERSDRVTRPRYV